jgi:eukaryotic-like serine/threonine-protein kinase
MADRVGQQLGHYRLLRLLGQGGFAEVYLGEHIYLDTAAAIKVLHTQLDSDDVEHFRSEARTIARLVHPHIVRVLDYGVHDKTPFLVVDYAPNGTLRKRYPKGTQLPLATVISYVNQVASALQYAHEQKVIHRDVKPENMLLGRRNEVLLSDFGIALVAQSSHYNSTQDVQDLAGTIAYMAPEQIQTQAGTASDQYSLGIVVYEWLSGTRPFHGSFAEIAVKHTLATPPSLCEKLPTLAPTVEAVVMKALAKDPRQRFASVEEFATALERASRQEGVTAPAPTTGDIPAVLDQPVRSVETLVLSHRDALQEAHDSPLAVPQVEPTQPVTASLANVPALSSVETPPLQQARALPLSPPVPVRRVSRRTLIAGLAGVAVVGALGEGVAWLINSLGAQGAPTAPLTPAGTGTALYTFRGHTSWVWSVAWSPAGTRIASASGDGTAQVWDAESGDHLNIYNNHTDTVYAVAWSPDGKRIASAGYDKTVQVWDATYGDHYFTYKGHTSWVWSVAWSPDGKHIASAGGDKTVQVWSALDGKNTHTYTGHSDFVYAVAWSPDGQYIASASNDGTVQIWRAVDGEQVYTYRPYATAMWSVAWSLDGKRVVSASSNGTAQIWDASNGNHLYVYYGHADFVYTVAWSPDGTRIASAGDDKTVQLWDAAYGAHPYTYTGHTGSVRSVAWSPDSKRIASGSWDKTVQVWRPQ